LERIEPIHVALYIEELQQGFSKPTVNSTWRPCACSSIGWSPAR
jgi:hypothetical protein